MQRCPETLRHCFQCTNCFFKNAAMCKRLLSQAMPEEGGSSTSNSISLCGTKVGNLDWEEPENGLPDVYVCEPSGQCKCLAEVSLEHYIIRLKALVKHFWHASFLHLAILIWAEEISHFPHFLGHLPTGPVTLYLDKDSQYLSFHRIL